MLFWRTHKNRSLNKGLFWRKCFAEKHHFRLFSFMACIASTFPSMTTDSTWMTLFIIWYYLNTFISRHWRMERKDNKKEKQEPFVLLRHHLQVPRSCSKNIISNIYSERNIDIDSRFGAPWRANQRRGILPDDTVWLHSVVTPYIERRLLRPRSRRLYDY